MKLESTIEAENFIIDAGQWRIKISRLKPVGSQTLGAIEIRYETTTAPSRFGEVVLSDNGDISKE